MPEHCRWSHEDEEKPQNAREREQIWAEVWEVVSESRGTQGEAYIKAGRKRNRSGQDWASPGSCGPSIGHTWKTGSEAHKPRAERSQKKCVPPWRKPRRRPNETAPHSAHGDPPAIGKGLGLGLPGAFHGACLAVQREELKLLAGRHPRPWMIWTLRTWSVRSLSAWCYLWWVGREEGWRRARQVQGRAGWGLTSRGRLSLGCPTPPSLPEGGFLLHKWLPLLQAVFTAQHLTTLPPAFTNQGLPEAKWESVLAGPRSQDVMPNVVAKYLHLVDSLSKAFLFPCLPLDAGEKINEIFGVTCGPGIATPAPFYTTCLSEEWPREAIWSRITVFLEESENQLDPKLFSFLLMVFVFIFSRTFVKAPPNLSCGTKR